MFIFAKSYCEEPWVWWPIFQHRIKISNKAVRRSELGLIAFYCSQHSTPCPAGWGTPCNAKSSWTDCNLVCPSMVRVNAWLNSTWPVISRERKTRVLTQPLGYRQDPWAVVCVFGWAAVPSAVTVDLRVTCFYIFYVSAFCELFYCAYTVADFASSSAIMIV
jgi:hypothetical protein